MAMAKSNRTRLFVIFSFVSLVLAGLSILQHQQTAPLSFVSDLVNNSTVVSKALHHKFSSDSLVDVRNSTFGFQKVFVINMPERSDKLDRFSLASSVTRFKFEIIKGVKGESVQNKSLPSLIGLQKKPRARNNIVGCWRAHLNFAQTIVRQKLTSAIVFEDDADWDTNLKDQLQLFAQGSQFVTGNPSGKSPHSPYGDDWDLIWLGHCGNSITPDEPRRFVIENDDTVPPLHRRVNFGSSPNMTDEGYDSSTRVVFRARNGCCLYAYALSYRGAQKLLFGQAARKTFTPIDVAIGQMCGSSTSDFKCIGVFPQLIDSHKAAGTMNRDSDIGSYPEDQIRDKGYTQNIVHSTVLNLERLLNDSSTTAERQWPKDPEIRGPPRLMPVVNYKE